MGIVRTGTKALILKHSAQSHWLLAFMGNAPPNAPSL